LSCCHRGGRCLPVAMRAVRTSGIPVASPTSVMPLARHAHWWKPPRPPPARSRERRELDERSEMPSIEQEPLPRDTLSSARLRTSPHLRLGRRDCGSRHLVTLVGPLGSSRARPPSTRPVASGRHASLSLGIACRLLQPETTRGHTLRAFDPRTRVELSPRYSPAPTDAGCVGPGCVAAPRACEPRPARCGLRTLRSTCVDWASRGPKCSSKGEPRAPWGMSRDALLVALRAPGSPARLAMKSGEPRRSSLRPRPIFDVAPRRATPSKGSGCLLPR